MSQTELKQLNQNTVSYLYQSIVSLNTQSGAPSSGAAGAAPSSNLLHPPIQSSIQQQFQHHPSLPKPLPDFQGQHEFEQRAQEYQAMNSKPASAPLQGQTDADHRESQDAMERKWLEQQRLRHADIEQFSPPSQVNGPQAINLNLLKSTAPTFPPSDNKEEAIQLKIQEINERRGEAEPKPGMADTAERKEPDWLKRIERIEELQEKMCQQMEQLVQHIFSTAAAATAGTTTASIDKKIGEIDE